MRERNSFLSETEVAELGFKAVGNGVKISRLAVFYGNKNISIGDFTRIDDFSLFSASENNQISLGNHVHIAAGVYLFGGGGIYIDDFVGISSGCKVYSMVDDFSGEYLTNPTIPHGLRKITSKSIELGRHSLIGAGTILLPGTIIPEGTAVGAMSMVNGKLEPWVIYGGIPVKKLKNRSRKLLELERNVQLP